LRTYGHIKYDFFILIRLIRYAHSALINKSHTTREDKVISIILGRYFNSWDNKAGNTHILYTISFTLATLGFIPIKNIHTTREDKGNLILILLPETIWSFKLVDLIILEKILDGARNRED
jgi:hypothetical protein